MQKCYAPNKSCNSEYSLVSDTDIWFYCTTVCIFCTICYIPVLLCYCMIFFHDQLSRFKFLMQSTSTILVLHYLIKKHVFMSHIKLQIILPLYLISCVRGKCENI